MPFESICPSCGNRFQVADEHEGKPARCPVCGGISIVSANPPDVVSAEVAVTSEPESPPAPVAVPGGAVRASSPVDRERWWLRIPEGRTFGPVSKPELDQWVKEGRILADCDLRLEGSDLWQPASRVYPALTPPTPFRESPSRTATGATVPHRGVLILLMGLVSWLVCCPVFGAFAWSMGTRDLLEMREGRMDLGGVGMTQGGRLLGLWHTILSVVVLLGAMLVVIITLVAH